MAEKGRRSPKWRGLGLYFCLLSMQTAGIALLLANGIPFYRLMALDFANFSPNPAPWWVIAGMVLIQVAYWVRVRLQPPLPRAGNIVLGHIVGFVARISFVAVGSTFTVMFLNRFEGLKEMNYPPLRVLAVLVMLFSMFCWTLELERLAKALQGDKHAASETHRN